MDRNDLSTLEWLQHLQEELMDATLYLEITKKRIMKNKKFTINERITLVERMVS